MLALMCCTHQLLYSFQCTAPFTLATLALHAAQDQPWPVCSPAKGDRSGLADPLLSLSPVPPALR